MRPQIEHCLSLDPRLDIAHKELADILSDEGEYEKAIDHYEEAIGIRPDFKEAKETWHLCAHSLAAESYNSEIASLSAAVSQG